MSVWFDRFLKGDYEITSAYQERTIDPDNFYALVLRSGGSINTTGYSNPTLDDLIDQARTETDDGQAQGAVQGGARHRVSRTSRCIFVHYETINYLMRKNVEGSTVNPTLGLRLENVGFTSAQ